MLYLEEFGLSPFFGDIKITSLYFLLIAGDFSNPIFSWELHNLKETRATASRAFREGHPNMASYGETMSMTVYSTSSVTRNGAFSKSCME